MADNGNRATYRIFHEPAHNAENIANAHADDWVLANINFYIFEGKEKVAMLFVRKAPQPVALPANLLQRR